MYYYIVTYQFKYKITMRQGITLLLALLIVTTHQAGFDITKPGKNGTIIRDTICNIQTTLEWQFSSSSTVAGAGQTTAGLSASRLKFLDAYGNDLNLPLTDFALDNSSTATAFVSGYGTRSPTANVAVTPEAAFTFKFSDGTRNVYVYIPVTTTGNAKNPDMVDLTASGGAVGSFVIGATPTPLTSFNMLDQTDYNLWYTAVSVFDTILVSNFIYKISSTSNKKQGSILSGKDWTSSEGESGDRLCYASTTTGNFQTHIRESVPLWFIWFFIFFYWLFYLLTEGITMEVFDKDYSNNRWTCISWYSLYHLAHQEFFTRLSRMTMLLINWSIQGLFIACIYATQILGSPMIIWTAVIAFVATIPFPFLFGALIHRKIYQKNIMKYENMGAMKGLRDKAKLEPHQNAIDTCDEKLYGYYHWFYSIAFVLLFICWPLAVNQMQNLGRTTYYYHWYWLASMGVTFGLEYLIYEPLLALLFGHTQPVQIRGGYYYDFALGQAYRAAQTS